MKLTAEPSDSPTTYKGSSKYTFIPSHQSPQKMALNASSHLHRAGSCSNPQHLQSSPPYRAPQPASTASNLRVQPLLIGLQFRLPAPSKLPSTPQLFLKPKLGDLHFSLGRLIPGLPGPSRQLRASLLVDDLNPRLWHAPIGPLTIS